MNLAFLAMTFETLDLSEHGQRRMIVMQLVGVVSSSSVLVGGVVATIARIGVTTKH